MSTTERSARSLRVLFERIASGDRDAAIALMDTDPRLVGARAATGATRAEPGPAFLDAIRHYVYAGDTALHIAAAAAGQATIVTALIGRGADVGVRNRRGAEPLHYAADGGPGVPGWHPKAQAKIIAALIRAGADPNARDRSSVAPLHRAVRNRSAAAVDALILGGADPRAANGNGSTPLALAAQNTGRSGSGSPEAKAQREEILRILMAHEAA